MDDRQKRDFESGLAADASPYGPISRDYTI